MGETKRNIIKRMDILEINWCRGNKKTEIVIIVKFCRFIQNILGKIWVGKTKIIIMEFASAIGLKLLVKCRNSWKNLRMEKSPRWDNRSVVDT